MSFNHIEITHKNYKVRVELVGEMFCATISNESYIDSYQILADSNSRALQMAVKYIDEQPTFIRDEDYAKIARMKVTKTRVIQVGDIVEIKGHKTKFYGLITELYNDSCTVIPIRQDSSGFFYKERADHKFVTANCLLTHVFLLNDKVKWRVITKDLQRGEDGGIL